MDDGADGAETHRSSPGGDGSLTRYLDALPTAVELHDVTGRRVHVNPAALALGEDAVAPADGGPTDGGPTTEGPTDGGPTTGEPTGQPTGDEVADATPWKGVHLVDQGGATLTLEALPSAACRADGQPHSATVGVRPEGADAPADDVLAHRWFRVHASPTHLPDGGRGVLVTYLDVTAQRHLEERLRQAALHDPLTGLPNRRLLSTRYAQAQASAARAGNHIGLVYLDLDRFKAVNDIHGHGAGDRFLREFGTLLQAVTRATDTAARVGGDEFVVLCTHLDGALHLQTAASRIANAVDGTVVLDGRRATVGASVGWVLVGSDMDLDAALNQAETTMYRDRARRSTT